MGLKNILARLYHPSGLRFRLTALVMTAAVLVLLTATTFIGNRSLAVIERNSDEQLQAANRTLATAVSVWLDTHLNTLRNLVSLPDIISMEPERQRPLLRKMADAYPYMYLVSTTDLKGKNRARNDNLRPKDYSDRTWFRNARDGEAVTFESLISRTVGEPALAVSMPIRNEAGRIIGVGMFSLNLDNLARQVRVAQVGETGFAYLVDSNYRVIAHPDPAYVKEVRDLSNYPPLTALRRGTRGQVRFSDAEGQRWRAYVDRLGNGWGVVVQQQEEELLATRRLFQRVSLAIIFIAVLVLMSLTWWAVRRALQPIEALTHAVSGIAADNTGRPDFEAVRRASLGIRTGDEVGTLAESFHRMAGRLDTALAGLEQELTERKRTEISLRESEEKYRTLVDNISIGVFRTTVGPQGRFIQANPAMMKMFGHASLQEFLNVPVSDLYQNRDERRLLLDEMIRNGFIKDKVLPFRKKDGTSLWCAITAAAQYDEQGNIKWMDGIIEDITARRKMEEELLKAQKLESVGLLAGGIAHDFNNLLTAILGNISLAKISPLDKINERLDTAEKASLRARDLTKQLLTFAKGGTPVRDTISLGEVIMNSAGFSLSGSKATCEFEIPEDLWPVNADDGQISQVINNLIMNAIQSMPEGGQITVRCDNIVISDAYVLPLEKGNYVRFSVKDQGTGIPEENLIKIFDPYFTTKEHGRGLGLASTYSIIKNHEGHITVESQVGFGATFTAYLPASDALVAVSEESERKPLSGAGRVLIMDDEEVVREVAGKMLTHLGYEVAVAQNGAEAIEMYIHAMKSGRPFGVVIMDLTIPGGMGGKETIQHLKKLAPEIKAIVSSGYSNDPILSNFQACGFAGVLLKPYRVDELGEQVRKVLQE